MKKLFIPVAVIAATILTVSAKKQNAGPVLMTVNGKDVPVSEFVYLYEKNNKQQAEPQTLDEYVEMFVNYKLKVADAEAAGIDTTETFRKEYVGYCNDLARPYMTDSTVIDSLRREAYRQMLTIRDVSHIMLPTGRTPDEYKANRERLDSIRTAIINGADFGEMAVRYSSDRAAANNRGHMGKVNVTNLPYPFVEAVYSTEPGQISPVFDDSPYGFHIVRVEGEAPNPGQVNARHILKLTRGLSPEAAAIKKAQIDSIYQLLLNGADFAQLAMAESEDGSARNGGALDWFGPGMMVPEFERTAFALADSAISEPFKTTFGYHIVQRTGHRDIPAFETMIPTIDRSINGDRRSQLPRKAKLAQLRRDYGISLDPKAVDHAHSIINAAGGLDSATIANLTADYTTMAQAGDKKMLVSDVAKAMPDYPGHVGPAAIEEFDRVAANRLDDFTSDVARERLASTDPAYRNLINEYRDGILLFEISNRNVWDKSNKDREGLEAYFNAHRDSYKWDQPRYKAIIVSATSDSVATAAEAWLKEHPQSVDSIIPNLRAQFGRNVKVERKVMPKGEDAVVDWLAFGAEKPANLGKWSYAFIYEGQMLDAPQEASDVRAAVVNDYQQWLEKQWLDELHKKYSVKINSKELKKLQKK